ncbi:alpha-L-fucosidase [Rugosimonospora africana]|uniref:alpha-L-fucosidase n=1 Tax=Rugosimonospora africana TaxID=556532 RepID=A0A8J3VWE4_9ACTN|nr:alpha-L-fucosidase [Rugosimonospora africana]GIH20859.1 alpha-L-fucosidase [Rugosimonospora africana]
MTTANPGPDGGEPRTAWFTRARFGLFIHWGIYAAAARHEWVKSQERLDDARYDAYFDHFDPDLYDPRAWAEEAWRAGMRYVVVTSKHHDGFCLWDSALTDYRATRTPHGKDLLRPLLDAFRDRGLRTGLYHSLLDWHHPQYPVDLHHPQRDDPAVRAQPRDIGRYADYLHGQVRELMSGYGRIDLAWFDFSFPGQGENAKGAAQWRSEQLLAMVRELQPHILVNDRLDLGGGDIITPEQVQPTAELVAGYPPGQVWEACHTLNGSWGYDRDNLDWKSADQLIRLLVDTVSLGGNLLLNVGPDARGQWEPRAIERLRGIGEWMRLHERSIREAGASRYSPPPDARYTQAGDRLYLHLFSWPTRHVHLPGLAGRVRYAQFLHDASEVRTVTVDPHDTASTALRGVPSGALTLELPVRRPDVAVPVVELFLGGQR